MNERARKQTHQSSSQASNELDELALRQLTVVHRGADAAVRRKVIVLGANLGQLQALVTKANSATPGERAQLTQHAAPLRHMAEDISAELDSIADGRLRAQAARVTMHAFTLFDQLDALQPPTHEANTSPAREGHEPAAPDQAEAPQAAHPVAPRVTRKQGVAVPRPDYTLEVATKSSVMGHNVALAGQLKFKRTRAVATIAGTVHDESGLALSGKSEALALERKFVIGKVPNGTMGQSYSSR